METQGEEAEGVQLVGVAAVRPEAVEEAAAKRQPIAQRRYQI
jgi:hypothetical protein